MDHPVDDTDHCLFVQVIKIQHKLDNIVTVSSKEQVQQENAQKPEKVPGNLFIPMSLKQQRHQKPMSL